MNWKVSAFIKLRTLFIIPQNPYFFCPRNHPFSSIASTALLPSVIDEFVEHKVENKAIVDDDNNPNSEYSTTGVFMKWGCSYDDISNIFRRRPSLRNADVKDLEYKLTLLFGLGISSSDLVKIINCRPRLLSGRIINNCFDGRIEYLLGLFGSKELFVKALVRNPSLLTYDLNNRIKPVVKLYEDLGLNRQDLVLMLMSRPTLIPRTSLDAAKMDYIRRSGVSSASKMYKYIVTLIAISRIETIREKLLNLEKFGFSEEEALGLIGRSPLVLTLSVDKVQRNMTFILGTMKLQACLVIQYPFLLYFNLENVLKPRVQLAGKIQDMGLVPPIKGPVMFTALRMTEKRFFEAFVLCHPQEVAEELMACYENAKSVKRLAEASKKKLCEGFPF